MLFCFVLFCVVVVVVIVVVLVVVVLVVLVVLVLVLGSSSSSFDVVHGAVLSDTCRAEAVRG